MTEDRWDFYRDRSGHWRWRRVASNGRIVAASSQGYLHDEDCLANAERNGYVRARSGTEQTDSAAGVATDREVYSVADRVSEEAERIGREVEPIVPPTES